MAMQMLMLSLPKHNSDAHPWIEQMRLVRLSSAVCMQRACRRHGIQRWPRRQLLKLSKAIDQINATTHTDQETEEGAAGQQAPVSKPGVLSSQPSSFGCKHACCKHVPRAGVVSAQLMILMSVADLAFPCQCGPQLQTPAWTTS